MPVKSKETYNSKTGNTFRAAESSEMMVKGICDMHIFPVHMLGKVD